MFLLLLMRDYAGIKLVFAARVSASAAAVHTAGMLNYPRLIAPECVIPTDIFLHAGKSHCIVQIGAVRVLSKLCRALQIRLKKTKTRQNKENLEVRLVFSLNIFYSCDSPRHKDCLAPESLFILHLHNRTMDGLKQFRSLSVCKASISCDRAVSWQWD